MNKTAIFILVCIIFFSTIQIAQAIDQQRFNYSSLKAEYINNHPEQAIIPFPLEPMTSLKVLPFEYEIPAAPGNTFSLTACRNEFESASFIITAQKNLSGIEINVPDLYNVQGNRIPSDAVNVRLVKVWYQAGEGTTINSGVHVLTPELLLKDDNLVKVDYVNMTNYLKVTLNGSQQFIDISTPNATFPSNVEVYDTALLQPFSLKTNENKQIWLTVFIPNATQAGDYYGNITITTPTDTPVIMNFRVTVLPFDLEPPPIQYGLFYRGILTSKLTNELGSESKSTIQYTAELQDMKNHGVDYPTMYQDDDEMLEVALVLRKTSGMPMDKIFTAPSGTYSSGVGNGTSPAQLATVAAKVVNWRNHTGTYGYTDTYFYGTDEATGTDLTSQRAAWTEVHNNSGKMYVASWQKNPDGLDTMRDVLDIAVRGDTINSTEAALWHDASHKIFLYNQPQVGIENPEIYRRNYGFALWNAGYDGTMNYAYQHGFGQSIWNDFDDSSGTHFRDLIFAYPTSNGVIDTIQWEGWREGVDDTRYVATLIKLEGNDISCKALVTDSLSEGDYLTTIREKIIKRILIPLPSNKENYKFGIVNSVWNLTQTIFGRS